MITRYLIYDSLELIENSILNASFCKGDYDLAVKYQIDGVDKFIIEFDISKADILPIFYEKEWFTKEDIYNLIN